MSMSARVYRLRSAISGLISPFQGNLDDFLRQVSGVIHVGANLGQERETYRRYGVDVLWIEPLPDIYLSLKENIKHYGDKQKALCALITDEDGVDYDMKIANNMGASSSIFEFSVHSEIFPDIKYDYTRKMKSITLPTLLKNENIDIGKYQALVLDVEGAEALVLKGAQPIIKQFWFVKAEAADFEARKGNATLSQLQALMQAYGFKERLRRPFSEFGDSLFWDVVWEKKTIRSKLLKLMSHETKIAYDESGSDKL